MRGGVLSQFGVWATAAALLAPITPACDSGDRVVARTATGGSGGECVDYVTSDGYTCCCGEPTCTRNEVGGCRHPQTTPTVNVASGGTGGAPISVASGGVPGSGGRIQPETGGAEPSGSGGMRHVPLPGQDPCSDAGTVVFDDGGIIVRPGGAIIEPDPSCPVVKAAIAMVKCVGGLGACGTEDQPISFAPCCLPDGVCGARGPHLSPGQCSVLAGSILPPEACVSYGVLRTYSAIQNVPDVARQQCTYRQPPMNAHVGEARDASDGG